MLQLPSFALGAVEISPLALLPLPLLVWLAIRPQRAIALVTCLTAVPLLLGAPGPGLVGGVVVLALLLRGLASPQQLSTVARIALLWLPVAVLQPPAPLIVWPNLVWLLPAALTASFALAAALESDLRWPLALVLAVLPFAPFGDSLLQPVHLTAALPLPQVAADWRFAGPGEIAAAPLAALWFLADRIARCLQFGALLLAWIAVRRSRPRLKIAALVLLLLALLLLAGQTVAALALPAHAPGFARVAGQAQGWDLAGVALALARIGSLGLLLAADLPPLATRLDAWTGIGASLTLALLTLTAPAFLGPAWFVDPLTFALLTLLLAALVRTRAPGGWAARAAGVVQIAAAAALAGGAWSGWATASMLHP